MYYYHKPKKQQSAANKQLGGDKSPDEDPSLFPASQTQEIDRRRHRVLDYMIRGFSVYDIADRMNEKVEVIQSDLEVLSRLSFQQRMDDLDLVRTDLMLSAQAVRREAWLGYEESKKPIIKTRREKGINKKGEPYSKTTHEKRIMPGDPRYLDTIIKAGEHMAAVSGVKKDREFSVVTNIQQNEINILSPRRSQLPDEFNRWTRKPDDVKGIEDREIGEIEE